jgi:hypothetical protein
MQKTGTVGTEQLVLKPSKSEASKRGRETSVPEMMKNCVHVSEVSVGDERRLNLLSEDPEVTEFVACLLVVGVPVVNKEKKLCVRERALFFKIKKNLVPVKMRFVASNYVLLP